MDGKKLFDYQLNEEVNLYVLLKGADVRTSKTGKQYLALVFADKSGEVPAKYWDASAEDVARFQVGTVVHVTGRKESYQGSPQIKIDKMYVASDQEPNNPALYVQAAPESSQTMAQEINEYLAEIKNPVWKIIVTKLLHDNGKAYMQAPAAKVNHHAFMGGLAYHSLSILRLAKQVADLYPHLNRDLLYAGAILHDLGKVIELSGPVGTSYTLAGNLIGHIVLVDEKIVAVCQDLSNQYPDLDFSLTSQNMLLLRHMVLAHHGQLEYGSPVRPQVMEAEVLHHLDDLDASIQMMQGKLDQTATGEFSDRIFGLDSRAFFKPENKA